MKIPSYLYLFIVSKFNMILVMFDSISYYKLKHSLIIQLGMLMRPLIKKGYEIWMLNASIRLKVL